MLMFLFLATSEVNVRFVVRFGWLLTSNEDTLSHRPTNGWLTGSEKAGLLRRGVGLLICKAKNRLWVDWQCDCSVTCLGLTILLLVSRNGSQSEGNWSRRAEMTQSHLSPSSSEQQRPMSNSPVTSLYWYVTLKDNSQELCLKEMTRQTWVTQQADVCLLAAVIFATMCLQSKEL